MPIAIQHGMSTKISQQTNGRIRATLPKATVDETGFHDLDEDDQRTEFRILCDGNVPALEIRFGPGVSDGPATTSPLVFASTGQVQLEFPTFMGRAWDLDGCELAWEDGTIEIDDDSTVTIIAPIDGWESTLDVDMWTLVENQTAKSTIQRSGEDVQNTVAMLPMAAVRKLGIERGDDTRVKPTFDCQSGRIVVVLTPTDTTRSEDSTGRSVLFAGPSNDQPRISAAEIAVSLGVTDILERGESVPMRWVTQDGDLIGFVTSDAHAGV
ncbi:hypothetical protein SAMN05421809_3649 [Natronorubrum daqingense]|uniref:Uncharacterized protein n=1 Tax=Natronorubrum daqingense TaxID=588898 RepID=A0A1N7G0Y8_9EURY|nr:hypothetical protein SAMN05421809_3649 [Natronorubrum daqingense]